MSEEIRVNRPVQQQAQPQHMAPQYSPQPMETDGGKNSKAPWIILGVVVIVLVVLGILFRGALFNKGGSTGAAMTDATSKPSGYQAIFLTNGQVYFGKINGGDTNYVDISDIYYLQVVTPPLQGNQQTGTTPAATSQAQPQISLVKLGNELHGPVDEMHISRPQILFYEDLKSDGQVVKAIMAYKASTAAPAATTPAAAAPAATVPAATAPAATQPALTPAH